MTPSPWTVNRSGVSVDAGPVRIRQERGADDATLRANARLIAAAPELLAMLREARPYVARAGADNPQAAELHERISRLAFELGGAA